MIEKVFDYLKSNNETISFAESCTGGNLSSSISKIPGASKIFIGSIVSYTRYSKKNILQISESELDNYSTVSQEITVKMAESVKEKFNTDYSIAITGNAGPSVDSPETNLGDCFIAILSNNEIFCQKFHFNCNRETSLLKQQKALFSFFSIKLLSNKIIFLLNLNTLVLHVTKN
jgi:nicotinamide-nucleotide amidase